MVPDEQILELHPTLQGERFSLHGVYRDQDPAMRKAQEYLDEGYVTAVFRDAAPSGNDLIFVVRRQPVDRAARAPIPHDHSAPWEATRMAVETFRQIERKTRSEGGLAWHKELEVEKIKRCMLDISWEGSRREVASEIISHLITTHPFPNANHRTSLALGRLYLRSVDIKWPSYSLRGRGAERFFEDTHPYYRDSKYLLRLLRSTIPMRVAYDEGYTHARVGPNTVAEIHEADLEMSQPEIRRRHRQRTAMLIDKLAGPDAEAALDRDNTRTLRQWVEWYE